MQTLAAIKGKVRTAQSLQSVVSTMRALALVNVRRFERSTEALAGYSRTIGLAMHVVLSTREGVEPPRLGPGEPGSPGVAVVLGSDLGLCGRFNDRIEDRARALLEERPWSVLVMGRRLGERMAASGFDLAGVVDTPTSTDGIVTQARRLLTSITELGSRGQCGRLCLVYTEHLGNVRHRETHLHLLPFDPRELGSFPDEEPFRTLPQHSLPAADLLSHLLPEYLLARMCLGIAHSLASENAARFLAMEGAARNIEERVDELMAAYHRQRQEEITVELMDVQTGASAVSPHGDTISGRLHSPITRTERSRTERARTERAR